MAARGGFFGRGTPHVDPLSPLTPEQRRLLGGARHLARYMDTRFSLFGFRFGLDALIGLIPGIGDAVSQIASVYLIWTAVQLRVPPAKLARMVINAGVDFLFGLVPFAGDAADAVFKSHVRNLRIIEDHVRRVESVYDTRASRG